MCYYVCVIMCRYMCVSVCVFVLANERKSKGTNGNECTSECNIGLIVN